MCLPCFPWRWTKYEDPLDTLSSMPEQNVWTNDGHSWALQRVVSLRVSFFIAFCEVYYLSLECLLWGSTFGPS
jgi:hypothetical protein